MLIHAFTNLAEFTCVSFFFLLIVTVQYYTNVKRTSKLLFMNLCGLYKLKTKTRLV